MPKVIELPSVSAAFDADALQQSDAVARPKFSRRPANLQSPNPIQKVENLDLGEEKRLGSSVWQDDVRFGVALVLLLLLFNISLMFVMPLSPSTSVALETAETTRPLTSEERVVLPASPVTFYAQTPRSSAQVLPYEEATSTEVSMASPMMPAPIAKPLNAEQSMDLMRNRRVTDSQ